MLQAVDALERLWACIARRLRGLGRVPATAHACQLGIVGAPTAACGDTQPTCAA